MKKAISIFLVFILLFSSAPAALAASDEAVAAANILYELGLFNGSGTDANGKPIFDLDRAPTRHEAVTMLVRLLGKESEATSGSWNIPFTDVADWAKPYVGYAYANGLTTGTSATTYGGNDLVTASQYLTFVLRALGYTSGTDFQWDKAWELSDKIGLTDGRYNAATTNFLRGDVTIVSKQALDCALKNQQLTLRQVLSATPEVPKSNLAPVEIKASIMQASVDALDSIKDALTDCSLSAHYMSLGLNSLGVTYAKDGLSDWLVAVKKIQELVVICGDYQDTQEVKSNLSKACELMSPLCTYTITTQNCGQFLSDLISTVDQVKPHIQANTDIFQIWAGSVN